MRLSPSHANQNPRKQQAIPKYSDAAGCSDPRKDDLQTSPTSDLCMRFCRHQAFSLVEVTLAMGVLSFAMIALFGLLPVGMQVFRDAIDTTVQTHIVQNITSLAEQTDFSDLGGGSGAAIGTKVTSELNSPAQRAAAGPVYYYFNDEGETVSQQNAIYTAAVVYWVPSQAGQTNLPLQTTSSNFATMWIDIYNNKGVLVGGLPSGKAQTFILHLANFGKRI